MYVYIYRVIGAILIVVGLYSVLWGKYKKHKEKEADTTPEDDMIVKGITSENINNGRMMTSLKEDDHDDDIEMQNKVVAISVPKA